MSMARKVFGTRNANDGTLKRAISIRLSDDQPKEDNRIRIIASTDDEVSMGYYSEKLLHVEGNVSRDSAASALFNHDRNQVIGGIVSTQISNGRMTAELEIDPEAKGANGLKILSAIRKGYLRGVSIGYSYRAEDCDVTEDGNGNVHVVARKWTLREISITPTPADLSAAVQREAPEFVRAFKAQSGNRPKERAMTFEAWLESLGFRMGDLSATQLSSLRARFEAEAATRQNANNTNEIEAEKKRAADALVAQQNAERALAVEKLIGEMLEMGRSHGVELVRKDIELKTREQILQMILERKAEKEKTKPGNTAVDIQVARDSADKANEAAEDALGFMAGIREEKNKGMRSASFLDVGRRWLTARGAKDVVGMDRRQLAAILLGKGPGSRNVDILIRDAANITSGMFTSYVLANVMDKVVYGAFSANNDVITYDKWVKQRQVQDFKTYSGAALDAGNLVETAENTSFPELAKDEGGYSDALSMWGATQSLTFQAIVNDDLGQFMEKLGMAGFIAKRTIDKKVYTVIEAATWTNRTTTGNLSDDNLNIVRNKLSLIAGPGGEVLGYDARYLIVPTGLRQTALKITTVPQMVNDNIKVNTDLIPIVTPFLTTKTTAANSEFYIATQTMFDPCVVATLAGVESPIVEEYDAGAVAARKWKIMMPFKVTVPTVGSNVQAMWNGSGS